MGKKRVSFLWLAAVVLLVLVAFPGRPEKRRLVASSSTSFVTIVDGWTVLYANDARPHAAPGGTGDLGFPIFPSDDNSWITFSSQGSVAARPPGVPHGMGAAPQGGTRVRRSFLLDDEHRYLRLRAAFVSGEPAVGDSDFLSIDVTDGRVNHNLIFLNTQTPSLEFSTFVGAPATLPLTLDVDLRTLFPGADATTPLHLTASLGNGRDGDFASTGHFDAVSYGMASMATSFSAPICQFQVQPGGDWLFVCHSPIHAGAEIYNLFSLDTSGARGYGPLFGLYPDALTGLSLIAPAGASPFHVLLDQGGTWSFPLPAGLVNGMTLDAAMFVVAQGQLLGHSGVARQSF